MYPLEGNFVLRCFYLTQGKLLYCIAPPGQDESEFQQIGYKLQSVADIERKDKQAKKRAQKQVHLSVRLFAAKVIQTKILKNDKNSLSCSFDVCLEK